MSAIDDGGLSETSATQSHPRSEENISDDDRGRSVQENDRPRWSGDAHRWRRLTQDERQLAESLDQIEADDLSIHLYNVHSLKKRVYKRDAQNMTKRWQSKRHWVEPGEWVPNKSWTAWPLKPDVVPRDGERFGKVPEDEEDEAWTARSTQRVAWKPSEIMEEVFMAEILRTAREKYHQRESEEDSDSEDVMRFKKKQKLGVYGKSRTTAPNEGVILNVESPLPESTTSLGKFGGSVRGKPQVFAGHPNLDASTDKDEDDDCAKNDKGSIISLRPVILADDAKAYEILQPSIRNMIQKIDDLLMGLHHSRQNHLDADAPDTTSDIDTPSSEEELLTSRRKSRSRVASAQTRPSSSPRSRSKTRQGKEYMLRYMRSRDWSEILGTAVMTGWSSKVVQRAATRCSELFGESMNFASLQEGSPGLPGQEQQLANHGVTAPWSEGTNEDENSANNFTAHVPLHNPWPCPEQSCPKHAKPFAHRWVLVRHVLRDHGYEYESSSETQLQTPPAFPEVTNDPKNQSCPFGNCRSQYKIFAKHWRLLEHLRRTHGWVKPPTSNNKKTTRARSASLDSGSRSGSTSESDAGSGVSGGEMFGGVHVDGFLQPMRKRKEWTLPRKWKRKSEDSLAKAKRNKQRKRKKAE